MKHFLLFILFCFVSSSYSQGISLYVGTYTDDSSKGIYHYSFNTKTGEISNEKLAFETPNPSFLAISKNKKYVYAVNEVNDYNKTNSGSVSSFLIQKNGFLQLLNKVSSNGAHPCHISLNNKGTKAAISNYTGGNISLHKIEKNGLEQSNQVINHNISSKKSHTHSAKFFKNSLFVADLGLNYLSQYKTVNFKYLLKSNYSIKNEAGPRHFEISKKGKFIYVINELNSTISVLKKGANNYSIIQNISTLEDGLNIESYCADIHISKNGKFLYASNRGENSIAVFKIDRKKGTINKTQSISTEGNWPRNFCISPKGKFVLVANQKSKNISVFKVKKKTGELQFLHSKNTPTPVCLIF